MEPTFKLAVHGIQPGHDPQAARAKLQPMLKDAAAFNDIFHRISLNETVVLGENIPKAKAQNLLEKLTAIGLKCRLDPMALSLVPIEEEEQQNAVYRCPACGHSQPPARGGAPDICERCGVVGQNYEAANELKQALEMERRRVKSTLDKEQKEKLAAVRDKADQQKEKAQQELLERARRQVEKEFGIRPWHKFKGLLKPGVLYPVLGSLTVGLIGIGLLLWQLGASTEDTVARFEPAGLQLAATPTPGPALQAQGAPSQIAPAGVGAPAPGVAQANAALPTTASAGPATAAPAITATPAITESGGGTTTPGNTSQTDHAAAGAPSAADATAPTQTVSLLDAQQLTLGQPAAGLASGPAPRDPWVLAGLARYQMQTGDLAAATRSSDRALEWLNAERGKLSSHQLDRFNRMQAEVQAEIAHQHHQRRDLAAAETYWFRATALANSIKTPSEYAQALSGLARAANDARAATAEDYFRRSIAALPLVTESSDQALTLGAIARNLAQTGRSDQSRALFERAAAAVNALQNPEERWGARTMLAKHYAEAGDALMAKSLLAQIASDREHPAPPKPNPHLAEAHSALALSLANQGETAMARARTEFAAALEQAQRLTDPVLWAGTLLYLARDIAAAGDPEAAATLVAAAGTWD